MFLFIFYNNRGGNLDIQIKWLLCIIFRIRTLVNSKEI